jgi:hypothetical protein
MLSEVGDTIQLSADFSNYSSNPLGIVKKRYKRNEEICFDVSLFAGHNLFAIPLRDVVCIVNRCVTAEETITFSQEWHEDENGK